MGRPVLTEVSATKLRGWFIKLEATLSLTYVTIQPFKHSILWETLPLEIRCVLALRPPRETPYDDLRAAVLANCGLMGDLFRPASELHARSANASQPHTVHSAP